MNRRSISEWKSCLACALAALAGGLPAPADPTPVLAPRSGPQVSRSSEPVLVAAAMVPGLAGRRAEEIGLFRWDSTAERFVPLVWQFDERVVHVFNEGTELEFSELIYDVFDEEDGVIDADDELVFLFGDAGPQAPPAAAWPENVEPRRVELRVTDSRPGAPEGDRWVYLFFGTGLPVDPRADVSWAGGASSDVMTPSFTLEFEDRWLMTGLRVAAPCGSGSDLLDRAKGRARPLPDLWEDEEGWNTNSSFLGGIVGPLRVIRYVRGATSGVNTILRDVIYAARWERTVNLRVHPILEAREYFDWLPVPGATVFAPPARTGAAVDGVPDGMATDFVPWSVFTSDDGGAVILFDVPLSPLYGAREFFYRDDASWDDAIPTNPAYGDDDDAAFGALGVRMLDITGSNIDPIAIRSILVPLCAGEGNSEIGEGFAQLLEDPLALSAESQTPDISAIRTLRLARDGDDVRLDWSPLEGADAYRIYASPRPDRAPEQWTLLGETAAPPWIDTGGALGPGARFYSVVTVSEGVEGSW